MIVIRFRPEAEEDVRLAIEWYEEQRTGLGDELLDVRELSEQRAPELAVDDSIRLGEARNTFDRLADIAIYFRVRSTIEVFAVFHARRDPRELRRQLR